MKYNKRIKLLTILLILLASITIIKFIIENYDPIAKEMNGYEYANLGITENPQIDETEKQLEFKNIIVLKELKGSLQITTVMEKVEKTFVQNIPQVLDEIKNMSNAKLSSYYKENSSDIKSNLNIDNEESFLNMVEKIKNLICDIETDYESCEFIDDGELKLVFSYNNNQLIECNIVGEHANIIMFEF